MISYRTATTATDRQAVAALITAEYTRSGYMEATGDAATSISDYLNRSETTTIMAHRDGVLTGTISVVRDSKQGLPMDSLYKAELAPVRDTHEQIAEVCQFAVAKTASATSLNNNLDVCLGLLSHAIHFSIEQHVTCVCFAINPKHEAFYRSLGSTQIGTLKAYPAVNNAPALAYILDLQKLSTLEETVSSESFFIKKVLACKPAENFFGKPASNAITT